MNICKKYIFILQLVVSSDHTEIDNDEVLLEYVELVKEPLNLSLINPDEHQMDENDKNSVNTEQPTLSNGN